jgi:hypothetical protein|tara:strand:- start:2625 stop:2780 length:156 start_codon:yes stop_codon:yes gene_type:complete
MDRKVTLENDKKSFPEHFEEDFIEVQKYITDPTGALEELCKKYKLKYEDES